MTPQEAIKALQFLKEKLYNGIFKDKIGAFDVAISSLEKQIPKKPLILGKQYIGVARAGICKNCSMTENNSGNYCRYCGQALDWSDTE